MSLGNLHIAWAELFLRAASLAGVTDVVLSPGSRSTPLAVAAASMAALRKHVIIDERAAAFFALGQARVTGRPSLLLCTSGTAGAHYTPAIIEAHQSFVPLLVVTADRPVELMDCAAPQTIDQLKLFGGFVRYFAELGLPDPSPGALSAASRIAAQAVSRSEGPLPGPVHVNARFRKPLDPVASVPREEPWRPLVEALMERGGSRVYPPRAAPDERAIAEIADRACRAERGLIVCGPSPLSLANARGAILALARATGFPLLAEGTSQIRFGGDRRGVLSCSMFDAFLRVPELRARSAPDLILELGAPPTSTGYAAFLAEHPESPRFVIAPHGWNDPTSGASGLVLADPGAFAAEVTARLGSSRAEGRGRWAAAFTRADAAAGALVERALEGERLTEGAVARGLVKGCPEGSILAIGNSTPVRDLDAYCPASERELLVVHQRGASGIDGLVSGAAGARSKSSGPVALLLGDLSLLHDLTGLAVARKVEGPLVIVVVQNGGGRIFEQLPIADRVSSEIFERYFATKEEVDLAAAAAAFGVRYARVETKAALDEALSLAFAHPAVTLVEAVVEPGAGAREMKKLWAALRAELSNEAREGAVG